MSDRIEIALRPYEWEIIAATLRWADKQLAHDPKWRELIDPRHTMLKLTCWIEDANNANED